MSFYNYASFSYLFCFGFLSSVFGTFLTSRIHSGGIEYTTYDMISNTWKIFHFTTSYYNHRVLLEIVPFASDIGGNFVTVSEANPSYFPQSRVWFSRSDS